MLSVTVAKVLFHFWKELLKKILRVMIEIVFVGRISIGKLVILNCFNLTKIRPHYLLCLILAAIEAKHLGVQKLTIVELGVANGDGLLNLCKGADIVSRATDICFEIYGFDSGQGLPSPLNYRDHPEIWNAQQFAMTDRKILTQDLPDNCHLILGDVKSTIPEFFDKMDQNAPLGFVVLDLDLYSSSIDGLRILDLPSNCLLPAVMLYADDVEDLLTYNSWSGEKLAIDEFNSLHQDRKLELKYTRISPGHIYCCHVLDHDVRTGNLKPVKPFEINITKYDRLF